MAFLPIEPKDNLGLSDPKLNLMSEVSISISALLVEGKENTRAGSDFVEPNVNIGTSAPSLGWCWLPVVNDGKIDGVGGSESTSEAADMGKVNPELWSAENFHFGPGLSMEIDDRTGLLVTEVGGFCRLRTWKGGNTCYNLPINFISNIGNFYICHVNIFLCIATWNITTTKYILKNSVDLT